MTAPWFKFYPTSWRADPALRMCSMGARGMWMEMLCLMHEAEPRGSLLIKGNPVSARQLAALCGCSLKEAAAFLEELEDAGVFSRDGEVVYSRRMRRDEDKAQRDKANGQKGGNPNVLRLNEGVNPPDNPDDKGADKAKNIEDRSKKEKEHGPAAAGAFDRFRKVYPRRDGSQDWPKARESFDRAVRAGVDPEAIVGGAERYAADCRRRGDEGTQFVKQARTWLNGRLWEEFANSGPSAPTASISPDWRALVMSFQRSGNWPSSLGPGPGFSGCRVPPPLLAEFGFGELDGVGGGT
ncbi:hypothetical protein [Xanthobacter flavus]|uniref:hypothetical protein n=1 Tax=Xanthobacter flavus TaxID=281 RepID=UPI003726C759